MRRGARLALILVLVAACAKQLPCDANSCDGCCRADGACLAGTEDLACGSQGAACTACGAEHSCVAQRCNSFHTTVQVTLTVDGVPCSQADLHGATSFELRIQAANGQELRAPFSCWTGSALVAFPTDAASTMPVTAVGLDRSGTIVLAGLPVISAVPTTEVRFTPRTTNTLNVNLGVSDGTTTELVVLPEQGSASPVGVCVASGQVGPTVTFRSGTTTRTFHLDCAPSTLVTLPVGVWTLDSTSLQQIISGLPTSVQLYLGQKGLFKLGYAGTAPVDLAFLWTFRRAGTVEASCEVLGIQQVTVDALSFPCRNADGVQGGVALAQPPPPNRGFTLRATSADGGFYSSNLFHDVFAGQKLGLDAGALSFDVVFY